MKYNAIKTLIAILEEMGVDFELYEEYNGYHIYLEDPEVSIIEHDYSIGNDKDLIEVMFEDPEVEVFTVRELIQILF